MKLLGDFLDLSIFGSYFSREWVGELCVDLVCAAERGRALESFGNKADSLHRSVKRCDENVVLRGYESTVRKCLKKLGLRGESVVLAVDTTKISYYGKNKGRYKNC